MFVRPKKPVLKYKHISGGTDRETRLPFVQ